LAGLIRSTPPGFSARGFLLPVIQHPAAMSALSDPFTPAQIVALLLFVFVASVTPGPNNAMLMASGAKFGLRRTVPHMVV